MMLLNEGDNSNNLRRWTEPVKFGFRWTVFGFFWLKAEVELSFKLIH